MSTFPDWKGQTVAVLAAGPSMTAELAETLREHRVIAVNNAHKVAPWADAMLGLDDDATLWEGAAQFGGIRMCGIPSDAPDRVFVGSMYERVVLAEGHVVEIRNSGLAAIRVAARCGAARIILAGFEPHLDEQLYPHVSVGLNAITSELRAAGVVVEHAPSVVKKTWRSK